VPVFLSAGGGYEKGEDALVNAFLLARCSTLIRTTCTQNLIGLGFDLQPRTKGHIAQQTVSQNIWHPESQIIRRLDTEYCPVDA
jgi:hypothetical protein